MDGRRYDSLVVGAGPAGSIAALVLARGGQRVALVDKTPFPRDKACGDLVGPRGVRLLDELGIEISGAERVEDMIVVGPTGRRVTLPCFEGETYPGHGFAMARHRFDAILHAAAVAAGAEPVTARAEAPVLGRDGDLSGFRLSDGRSLRADAIIGADGATSRVAAAAGLVEPSRVLWGFALRAYVDDPVRLPHIVLWEEERGRGFPGYGWLFPGVESRANLGLGLGLLADRSAAARAARAFDAFTHDLRRFGVLTGAPESMSARTGGWLKMGMAGTTPARGRVLLTGDAAGLVNPLQGEGISQAMGSARAAAQAILAGPHGAAARYQSFLAEVYLPYQSLVAPLHRALLPRPVATATLGRVLTAPGVGRAVAGGWSLFWNDLVAGARPGPARRLATAATAAGRVATGQRRYGRGKELPVTGAVRDPNRFAQELFRPLPRRYDLLEELLSLGQNRRWRHEMLAHVADRGRARVLDVATGTAGVALELVQHGAAHVVGLDLTEPMLRIGQARIGEAGTAHRVQLVAGQAERVPAPDAAFDALTFTYLLRYVADPAATLRELTRVLKPGAPIASLEFAVPTSRFWRAWWWLYTRAVLPVAGYATGGVPWYRVGRFLGPDISGHYRRYPVEWTIGAWQDAGLVDVGVRSMSLGGGLVMWARKPDR